MRGPAAGDLNQLVTILAPPTSGGDGYGQDPTGAWPPVVTVWASVKQTQGRESPNADRMKAVSTIEVEMRHLGTTIPQPTAINRLMYRSRTFAIESVANVEERDYLLRLVCKEVVNKP